MSNDDGLTPYERVQKRQKEEDERIRQMEIDACLQRFSMLEESPRRFAVIERTSIGTNPEVGPSATFRIVEGKLKITEINARLKHWRDMYKDVEPPA